MGYVWGLDLVRFAAALMVVVWHFSHEQPNAQIIFDPGWVGVEIFFVISGFVIMGSAMQATPIEFLERRFARLYPTALACALINFAALRPFANLVAAQGLYVNAGFDNLLRSILLLRGPFMVSALWTIPVELAFYALIFLVLMIGRIDKKTLLAGSLIFWSGLYLVPFALSECGISQLHVAPLGAGMLNMSLLRHGCFFGVGILIWQVLRRQRAIDFGILAIGIILCFVEIIARSAELHQRYFIRAIAFSSLAYEALVTFTVAVLAIWLLARVNDRVRLNERTKRILRLIGLTTYPLYLMHEGVGGVAYSLLREWGLGQGAALLIGLSLSLMASLLVVLAVEPLLRRWMLAGVHPLLARLTANVSLSRALGTFRPPNVILKPVRGERSARAG